MTDVDLPLLDDSIVQLPADIRQGLRDHAGRDLYMFGQGVMGFRDMTRRAHGELCQFVEQPGNQFKLILMPRGFFKSSVVTIAGSAQRALVDPDSRTLIANETATNAEHFLGSIASHFQSNRTLRALFSDVIPKDVRKVSWNNQEIELVRNVRTPEKTITALGMTGASTSRHFTHIHVDDPISIEAVRSSLVMKDTIERLKTFTKLFVHPEESTFTYVGTRWAFYDTVVWFEDTFKDCRKFIRAAYDDKGELLFPERLSAKRLAEERAIDEYLFSCNYLNAPRNAAAQDLDTSLLRHTFIQEDDKGEYCLVDQRKIYIVDMAVYTTVDLAPAEDITSDRNAVVTVGITPWSQAVVLDAWADRCQPSAVMDKIFSIDKRFHPQKVGIEGVAYQKAFKFFLKDEMERRQQWFKIEEVRTERGGGGKRKPHIRGLQPLLKMGRLFIDPTMHLLKDEMMSYPLGKHDDVVDALAMQLRLWDGQLSPDFFAKLATEEKRLMMGREEESIRRKLDLDPEEAVDWSEASDEAGIETMSIR